MERKKHIFIQQNKSSLLGEEHTHRALDSHAEFPLENYICENLFKHFESFKKSVETIARISQEPSNQHSLSSALKFAIEKRKNIAIIDEFSSYQLANYLSLPVRQLTLNRNFLEQLLAEEEGSIKHGRQET